MKRSTSNTMIMSSLFSVEEIDVANIILDLPNLISESDSTGSRFSCAWGAKKRRSTIDSSKTSSPPSPSRIRSSPSPHHHLQSKNSHGGETETERRRPKVKVEAASPSTPLSFSPSESDDKSKLSLKRNSKKRTREDWLEMIEGLTQRRELLRGEVETVRNYYNKLLAFNLELKAQKQLLNSCLRKEKPHLDTSKSLNLGMKLDRHCQIPVAVHQEPFMVNQIAYESQMNGRFQYPHGQRAPLLSSNSGLGTVTQFGPFAIPDLNVCAEETFGMVSSQPLDLNRALTDNRVKAAEARKRRMIKIKEMKYYSFAALKAGCL